MNILKSALICGAAAVSVAAMAESKLSGNVIGTELSVDYATGAPTTTINTREMALDGDLNTFFASYDRSFTWVGLEFDQPYVITKIGYAARNDNNVGPGRMQLGVFQGANEPDFSDALPIYLIPGKGVGGEMTYVDVNCSKGFKYVRYVGPHDARCNVAEIEFWGEPGEGDENALYQVTNLPTLVVNTPGMEWFHENDKEYELNGSMISVISEGKFDVSAPGQIRGRGNASWGFPKKPFRIKFDKKQTVMGGAKAKKWAVINNYGDKTLMRNRLAFDISERLGMDFTPACHFVDVIFNGEYQGCYQLCDQVDVNSKRVNITEMEASDTESEALTGGYLVEIDAYASQEAPDEWFNTTRGYSLPVTIKSPDAGVPEQYAYIKNKMSSMSALVRTSYFDDPERGYRSMLDLDSFLKHFIVGEVSGNTDTYWSVYMSLDRGSEQFHTGPVWDFDLAFNNDIRIYPVNGKPNFIYKYGSHAGEMLSFVNRIIDQDAAARERLKYLWSYAREYQGLDADTFTDLVDRYEAELQQSQDLNFKRWPIMNEYVHQNPRIWGSYAAEVNNVRTYLKQRFDKLDQLIGRVQVESVLDLEADAAAVAPVYYNLQGIAAGTDASLLSPGLYIERRGAQARKVLVK